MVAYFIFLIIGVAGGALCMFIALDKKRKVLAETTERNRRENEYLTAAGAELVSQKAQFNEHLENLRAAQSEFNQRIISYNQFRDENVVLKRDLKNVAVSLRKSQLDHLTNKQSQDALAQRVELIGKRYLNDCVKWISDALTVNNFVASRQRLQDLVSRLRGIGFTISEGEEAQYVADLKAEYERLVKAAFEREEQSRIKAQIREEQKREREIQREQERLQRETQLIEVALAKALAEAKDQHSAEVESLKAQLEEAEAKKRAISQAQITKSGYIYVISNIGSFGENVFKVGMTRRLTPQERVDELGDASVPFPFDVHMMINCDNAPALENALHRGLVKAQVNKMNPRKEFFRTDIHTIAELVSKHHGEVKYTIDAEALQYRQSLTMSDEDARFIEHVFDETEEDSPGFDEEPVQKVLSSL